MCRAYLYVEGKVFQEGDAAFLVISTGLLQEVTRDLAHNRHTSSSLLQNYLGQEMKQYGLLKTAAFWEAISQTDLWASLAALKMKFVGKSLDIPNTGLFKVKFNQTVAVNFV